jgi:CheY-like chemotaxis protein
MSPFLPPSLGSAVQDNALPNPLDWRCSGRILVVDDEDPVRTVVARAVNRIGFVSDMAADGPSALALFEADPTLFTLVIVDIKIPGMDGLEIMARLRQIRPDVPVILMSGYNKREVPGTQSPFAVTGYLHKPFTLAALASELRAVLEH